MCVCMAAVLAMIARHSPQGLAQVAAGARWPWPRPSDIKHVDGGSHTFRAIEHEGGGTIMTAPELSQNGGQRRLAEALGLLLSDYVGRYVYFPLKWGTADVFWPEHRRWRQRHTEPFFARIHDPWMWMEILLKLPEPQPFGGLVSAWLIAHWNLLKSVGVVVVVTYPLVLALALCQLARALLWTCRCLSHCARCCGTTICGEAHDSTHVVPGNLKPAAD
eukprot:COSAG01_NODE_6000_length_3908_cov_4.117616_6_plen_219_part_00